MIHLSIPIAPKVAACGAANAKSFTFWRWKATCTLCKAVTAAVAFDTVQQRDTLYRADLPIRYSKLVAFVRANGATEEAIAEFERDKQVACSVCPKCKADLSDPIALLDVKVHRMVFACPKCSTPKLCSLWEDEGR